MNNHKFAWQLNVMLYCLLLNLSRYSKVKASTAFKMSLFCLRLRTVYKRELIIIRSPLCSKLLKQARDCTQYMQEFRVSEEGCPLGRGDLALE